jgi:hypothetical protein
MVIGGVAGDRVADACLTEGFRQDAVAQRVEGAVGRGVAAIARQRDADDQRPAAGDDAGGDRLADRGAALGGKLV